MLIVFLLVLSAVRANESVDQDALRKPRQLDLGLQDIRTGNEELLITKRLPSSLKDGITNGYLPPTSSEVVSAQSQQAFDFKSVNSVEKESELCKPPFDNEACNFKDSSASDSKIPKPSRDLVPPFKDVEQELAIKATTVLDQTNKKITTTTRAPKVFTSTTEKSVNKFFKHEPNRKFNRIKPNVLRSKVVGNKAEATNELRSYLPPQSEFSAAAQTNVAVVQPANGNNNHDSDHHHGHHHGDNFNICDDAFHSFLCAPLKARKRITGALPARLLGESSFINYQKTLASFDRETASSNGFRNEYLPPSPSSTNFFQSTYSSPLITSKPASTTFASPTARPYSPSNFVPQFSNFNDNTYLPPGKNSDYSVPVKSAPSNTDYSTTKFVAPSFPTAIPTSTSTAFSITVPTTVTAASSTTSPTIASTSASTAVPATAPTTAPTAAPTTASTAAPTTVTTAAPTTAQTTVPTTAPTAAPTTMPSTTAASTTTLAPTTFSKIGSGIVSDSFLQSAPTAQSTFNSGLPTIPVFSGFSSKENSYLPPTFNPQPSASFVSNSKSPLFVSPTFLPSSSSFAPFPSVTYGSLSSNSIISSQKPKVLPTLPAFTSTFGSVTTPKPFNPVSSFGFQPLGSRDSYLPPVTQFQSSFGPSSTTLRPFSGIPKSTARPSSPDLKYLPPDNKEPAAAQISSATVAAPQNNNPFHHGRDLCTDPFHSFLCTNAKPRKKITGELPLGFKLESSNIDELRLKPEPSNQDDNKVRDDQSSVGATSQNGGYKYTKPVASLPSSVVPPSAASPSLTDYSFFKPDKTFSSSSQQDIRLPSATSTRRPEPTYRPSEAKTASGYQYPRPDQVFPLPGGQENTKVITTTSSPTTGYSYPRPQKPLSLPTEQKEVRQKPKQRTSTSPTSSSSTLSPTNVPLPANQARGYQYPKPDISLNIPDKKGYSYPKPEKKLELPGESRPKSLLPQSNSNLNGLGSLEAADFIPVNKVEFKRAESSKLLAGLKRFGERMKKRERQALLLKRQSH